MNFPHSNLFVEIMMGNPSFIKLAWGSFQNCFLFDNLALHYYYWWLGGWIVGLARAHIMDLHCNKRGNKGSYSLF